MSKSSSGSRRILRKKKNGGKMSKGSKSSSSTSSPLDNGIRTVRSNVDFDTTVAQLLAAIGASPASVAFTVDHDANSGGALPPTELVRVGGQPRESCVLVCIYPLQFSS